MKTITKPRQTKTKTFMVSIEGIGLGTAELRVRAKTENEAVVKAKNRVKLEYNNTLPIATGIKELPAGQRGAISREQIEESEEYYREYLKGMYAV